MGCPQVVKVGNNTSTSLIFNTEATQGCVLSPLLYFLFTHDCVATQASNSIIKFADDITVGLITNNDETAYSEVVRALGVWCQENNLSPNVNKTKELIVDFLSTLTRPQRRRWTTSSSLAYISQTTRNGPPKERVVKAQQRLFNHRRLKKFGLAPKTLKLLKMHN